MTRPICWLDNQGWTRVWSGQASSCIHVVSGFALGRLELQLNNSRLRAALAPRIPIALAHLRPTGRRALPADCRPHEHTTLDGLRACLPNETGQPTSALCKHVQRLVTCTCQLSLAAQTGEPDIFKTFEHMPLACACRAGICRNRRAPHYFLASTDSSRFLTEIRFDVAVNR